MSNKSDLRIEQDDDKLCVYYHSVLEYFLRSFLLLKQKEMAGASAVSDGMICRLEAGDRSAKTFNLRRIALKFEISIKDFYHILENKVVMEELVDRLVQTHPIDHPKDKQAMMKFTKEADLNFSSMQILVSHRRYSHALYFLNQNIQCLLFALFIKIHQVTSPLVENNSYLIRTIDAKKAIEQTPFLKLLQQKLNERDLAKEEFNQIILQSMKLRKWMKNKLTEPMAPPPKLKYNRPKKALLKKIKELKESMAKP